MGWLRGMSRYQATVLVLAWLGWVFDVMDAALFNFAKGSMLTDMLGKDVNPAVKSAIDGRIQSWFLFGWALGGLFFGLMADRWGRTRTLIVTILLYSLFTAGTAFCRTPEQVMLARFLTALGIGGEWAAGAALVAEAFRSSGRAPAAIVLQSAAAFGPALAALANLGLAGKPWQWLFFVGLVPAVLCGGLRFFAHDPESTSVASRPKGNFIRPIRELFADPLWRRHAIVAMIVGAVGVAGAGTATYWAPNLVEAASQGMAKADIDTRKSIVVMLSHIGTLAGVIVVPLLCERFGRKWTIAAFFLASPLVVILALSGGASYQRLQFLLPLVNFFAIGVSAAFVLYFPELFPDRMRATGAGLAYNVGRLAAIPMPAITGAVVTSTGGSIASAVILSGTVYVFGLLAIPFAPETRGKALPV